MNTQELIYSANENLLFNTHRPDIIMEKGTGMYLWDTEGKKYLDFIGGWAVTCLGHCPAAIANALEKQSKELVNASPAYFNVPMIQFARLLTDISCFDRVFFTSTGAEANEGAIKLARKYGSRNLNGAFEIITTVSGFHGRTLAMMSATGKKHWEPLFAPKVSGFKHVPFNDLNAVRTAISPNTCAIMLELIQGEGGVNPADIEYVKGLRELCDKHGILLIFDEIQTGLGRTGTMFCYEQYGIEPDIMTLAKGIGGGFPLSAMLAKEKYNIFEPGDQGGTYCGQPLAMAVGIAVVNELIEKGLPHNAEVQGEYIKEKLLSIKDKYKLENIRGKGLLLAFDLPDSKGPEIVEQCLKNGLLVNSPNPKMIRLMPALIIRKEDIDLMVEILSGVLDKVL